MGHLLRIDAMIRLVALAIAVIVPVIATEAAEADARKSMTMLSHWQCFQWASMQDLADASEAHFELGLMAGEQFMEAVVAGTITPDEGRAHVPVIVSMTLSGPNEDFVLGRMFESISTSAYRDVAEHDASGMLLDPIDYILDEEYLSMRAQTEYHRANCSILLD